MSLQPDINALLHNMRAQIQALTTQLAELQANPPAANPSVEKKFNKKVEVANWDAFADDFEVATAVLSRLKGPVAGRYTQVRLQECYTAGVWPTWDNLKVEIKKYFKLQAERDWACQQICSFKQGNMRTDDFVTRFLALSIQGGLGNDHAVELLECNVNPHIAEQLYLQDMRNENLSQAAEEVPKIGRAIELYKMHQGGETTKNNQSQRRPGQDRVPLWILARSKADRCTDSRATVTTVAKRDTCPEIAETGCRPLNKKINQGRQVRQLETKKPNDRLSSLAGRSYNKIWAFFYDQQVNEMKAQGKEFGA
ncbi:hypothetical protein SERLA73DRAFT_74424 [Serpula lacrymans var. lacrymans S7.3]|uniref:Retrotransposon gag domain-containing protein n=1 Tax=Serpula lacrymans var. lacrymans (strain S7.3) TaxID=936435 RepID=F8Q1L8_SERL3|nr:hypothetical protein SERLA73DRAFT_74424 [Serpula lacrymans var. lacrymans S7.3]